MLGLAEWQQTPDTFGLTLVHHHEMRPAVIAKNPAIVLLRTFVRMQHTEGVGAVQREDTAAHYDIDFTPGDFGFSEARLDARHGLGKRSPGHVLFFGRMNVDVAALIGSEPGKLRRGEQVLVSLGPIMEVRVR